MFCEVWRAAEYGLYCWWSIRSYFNYILWNIRGGVLGAPSKYTQKDQNMFFVLKETKIMGNNNIFMATWRV